VRYGTPARYRRENNPAFNRFVGVATKDNNSKGQKLRYMRARTRLHTFAAREEANDFRRIRALLSPNLPDKDDVVSDIFEALLNGSRRREDVRARIKLWHRLRMYGLNDRVRSGRQETKYEMRTGNWFGFRATVAPVLGPDPRESEQRPFLIEREPNHVLFLRHRLRLRRIFGEAVCRHQAAVFRL
jgi:hypothetical protein